MATPTYKLHYFDLRALGEPVRYMFAAAGVEYEDNRVSRDLWPAKKPRMPFGQMPVLEFNGKMYCQSKAICSYLGAKFNMTGETDEERLEADMIGDCIQDIQMASNPCRKEAKEGNHQLARELGEVFQRQNVPTFLANFQSLLERNNGGNGYFVGSKMTWIDVYFTAIWEHLYNVGMSSEGQLYNLGLDAYPKLQALVRRVQDHPGIADWRRKRPDTAM